MPITAMGAIKGASDALNTANQAANAGKQAERTYDNASEFANRATGTDPKHKETPKPTATPSEAEQRAAAILPGGTVPATATTPVNTDTNKGAQPVNYTEVDKKYVDLKAKVSADEIKGAQKTLASILQSGNYQGEYSAHYPGAVANRLMDMYRSNAASPEMQRALTTVFEAMMPEGEKYNQLVAQLKTYQTPEKAPVADAPKPEVVAPVEAKKPEVKAPEVKPVEPAPVAVAPVEKKDQAPAASVQLDKQSVHRGAIKGELDAFDDYANKKGWYQSELNASLKNLLDLTKDNPAERAEVLEHVKQKGVALFSEKEKGANKERFADAIKSTSLSTTDKAAIADFVSDQATRNILAAPSYDKDTASNLGMVREQLSGFYSRGKERDEFGQKLLNKWRDQTVNLYEADRAGDARLLTEGLFLLNANKSDEFRQPIKDARNRYEDRQNQPVADALAVKISKMTAEDLAKGYPMSRLRSESDNKVSDDKIRSMLKEEADKRFSAALKNDDPATYDAEKKKAARFYNQAVKNCDLKPDASELFVELNKSIAMDVEVALISKDMDAKTKIKQIKDVQSALAMSDSEMEKMIGKTLEAEPAPYFAKLNREQVTKIQSDMEKLDKVYSRTSGGRHFEDRLEGRLTEINREEAEAMKKALEAARERAKAAVVATNSNNFQEKQAELESASRDARVDSMQLMKENLGAAIEVAKQAYEAGNYAGAESNILGLAEMASRIGLTKREFMAVMRTSGHLNEDEVDELSAQVVKGYRS